ncbi:uncharacterized protein V6R79_014903 [Siganus canaliculatus]
MSPVILRAVFLSVCLSVSTAVRILTWPPLNCSGQGLQCTVNTSNCMDTEWVKVHEYTPSDPEDLQVSVDTRLDGNGHLQPVLAVKWSLKDDGGIHFLSATEIHVLVMSTNHNLCVRYSFQNKLQMRNPSRQKWSFSANMVVLDPGQRYLVSVSNIPKPEMHHSKDDVSAIVEVPGCQDPKMQRTQFCIERGSLWQPNISLVQIPAVSGTSALALSFIPDNLCEKYTAIAKGCSISHAEPINKSNQTTLNVTFSLDKWPRSCCQFEFQLKPHFPQCGNDCTRRRKEFNICTAKPTAAPDVTPYTAVIPGVMFVLIVTAVIAYVIYRKSGKSGKAAEDRRPPLQEPLKQCPKVLIIYSKDHKLYRDVVLKLCAFLQDKCGTKVLLDLLDSSSLGMVGPIRWLEWQRQQLTNPADKILVLCSRGVQAKWRAMCGHGRVTLREDDLSSTDDLVIPFLNLSLPDLHHAGTLGRYMVAYFDDISSKDDVPSVFDIVAKYKLMKHFEELYFRILDIEKYQPDQVNHIEGIGGNEYFKCPSGEALKKAIETFQAYQLENPDWFEQQCINTEEEAETDMSMISEHLQAPVLECVPLIRSGPPVFIQEVDVCENGTGAHVLTPEPNIERGLSSVAELIPQVNTDSRRQHPSHVCEVLTNHSYPYCPSPQPFYSAEPVPQPGPNWFLTEGLTEEGFLQPVSHHSAQRSSVLGSSPDPSTPQFSCGSMQTESVPWSALSCSQPVSTGEQEVMERLEKVQSSGSDQGYISKLSSQPDHLLKEDPMAALRRLQEDQFQRSLHYFD